MKDAYGASVAAIIIACLLASGGLAQQTQIFNSSFEQLDEQTGLPAGWSVYSPTRNMCAYTLATAHSGVASALITDDSEKDSQGLRSKPAPIEGGKTYQARGWVKIIDARGGGFAIYLEFWKGTQRVLDKSVYLTKPGDWAELKIAGEAPREATEATILIYGSSGTVGTAYFDDVALTAVE